MEKEELMLFVESLGGAVADQPFSEDFETVVLRHGYTRKWFGIWLEVPGRYLGEEEGEFCLNLKCPPDLSGILAANYRGILPAYHMNKRHWITVRMNADVPKEEICELVRLSYDITSGKKRGL